MRSLQYCVEAFGSLTKGDTLEAAVYTAAAAWNTFKRATDYEQWAHTWEQQT